jgi:hypothetical protein
MNKPNLTKATNDEIQTRFDNDVERFSNLETGQQTTIDALLTIELCTEAAHCGCFIKLVVLATAIRCSTNKISDCCSLTKTFVSESKKKGFTSLKVPKRNDSLLITDLVTFHKRV